MMPEATGSALTGDSDDSSFITHCQSVAAFEVIVARSCKAYLAARQLMSLDSLTRVRH